MKYILSTMTNSVSYAFYRNVGDLPVMRDKITIKGGTGLPSIRSGFGEVSKDGEGTPLWTANGIITPIEDGRYEQLKDHPIFLKHLEQGFVKVLERDISENHREVTKQVATMEKRDGFAQLNPSTIAAHTKVKISTKHIDSDTQFRI